MANIYNKTGTLTTSPETIYTCGFHASKVSVNLTNIGGANTSVSIKIFNKAINDLLNPSNEDIYGTDIITFLAKDIPVVLTTPYVTPTYYLNEGDYLLANSADANSVDYFINVETNI
jgi:hypothetical protein